MNISNPIFQELLKLKLIRKKNIIKISNTTRDKNIKVYKDKKSSVIFLEKYISNLNYYLSLKDKDSKSKKTDNVFTKMQDGTTLKSPRLKENDRRISDLSKYFKNKSVLDFGCGWGFFLKKVKKHSKKCSGVEIKKYCLDYIKKNSKFINVEPKLKNFNEKFDVITLWHVLEHLPYQVNVLKDLKKKLKKKGKIIVEVPHANDFLILLNALPEFNKFTFRSDHLILHTFQSLKKILLISGFKNIKIKYLQRHGFTNHLGWFLERKPGGQNYFKKYEDKNLEILYKKNLEKRKQTDTLIAIAEK